MSLLCISVDNSQTSVGLFAGDRLESHWRVATDPRRTADDWGLVFGSLLERRDAPVQVTGVCVASAVPLVLRALRLMVSEYFRSAHSLVVGPGVRTGLSVLMDNPREVGTDRIGNAVAAVQLVGHPSVVVDFGTATTFDVVNQAGQYVGGAIAPGIEISLAALGARGAQLRQVELVRPRSVIAKNTIEALQSGAIYGFAGLVDGLVSRIATELGRPDNLPVVATGVLAPAVLDDCATITRHEPHLTLHGLRLIYDRNPGSVPA
ncbi:MAG: type III pantothenate kinase [Nocardioidaceae bacterium]